MNTDVETLSRSEAQMWLWSSGNHVNEERYGQDRNQKLRFPLDSAADDKLQWQKIPCLAKSKLIN